MHAYCENCHFCCVCVFVIEVFAFLNLSFQAYSSGHSYQLDVYMSNQLISIIIEQNNVALLSKMLLRFKMKQ